MKFEQMGDDSAGGSGPILKPEKAARSDELERNKQPEEEPLALRESDTPLPEKQKQA